MFEKRDNFMNGHIYAVILGLIDIKFQNLLYTRAELNQLSMFTQKKSGRMTSRLCSVLLKFVQIKMIRGHRELIYGQNRRSGATFLTSIVVSLRRAVGLEVLFYFSEQYKNDSFLV